MSGVGLTEWSSCHSVLEIISSDHRYGLPWSSTVALWAGQQCFWWLVGLGSVELGGAATQLWGRSAGVPSPEEEA